MLNSRVAARAARTARVRSNLRQLRYESTNVNSNNGGSSQALLGGIAGGATVFGIGYGYYHWSGAKSVITTAKQAKQQVEAYKQQFKQSAPEPSEALGWLRQTANSYAAFIPGGRGYVDTIMNDIEAVQQKHHDEVNQIIKEAYNDFKGLSNEGLSAATAQKAWEILAKHSQHISELASDSMEQIIDNHPRLKEQFGDKMDQLKQMGENYGPEAKKQVDETWDQVREVLKGGLSASSIPKIQSLVQDKMQKMQELGNKVWDKGMEQAKPYLDKSPEVKELVEKNADKLKQGNVNELYGKIKDAVQSGNTEDLKKYVNNFSEKVRNRAGGGGGLESWMKMVPGGSEVLPKLQQLQQLASEHGEEAEKITKSTFYEIEEILQKKVSEAQELANKAKKNAS